MAIYVDEIRKAERLGPPEATPKPLPPPPDLEEEAPDE